MENQYFECSNRIVFSVGAQCVNLGFPSLEIDDVPVSGKNILSKTGRISERGVGFFPLSLTGAAKAEMEVRLYPGFVRIRYRLGGSGARLTKPTKKDVFCYTCFEIPPQSKITEVQLNQYTNLRHTYLPQIMERPETAWLEKTSFAGPVLLAEYQDHILLCAYEHGGEYTDNFLGFTVNQETGAYAIKLECCEGTYCNGTYFSDREPYVTPWFQIGLYKGNSADMLKQYRNFILHDMPESPASRTPYIFYNTWNNQERNRAFRGRKYLQDMSTKEMLKDIDVAHSIGIDVFVLDSGWYKSTGDWEVDPNRFPDNLKEIRAHLDSYGMKLGLWFNPTAAAVNSQINREHPEYRKQINGEDHNIGPVWETEESYGMCLVSDYADWFIEKLVSMGERYGVRYFKWDGVDMGGCTADHHHHGGPESSPEERERYFRFQCGLALTRIASEVSRRLPGAIVDLDVTEGGRYVGLGFLTAGKFFHMNNGPYYHDLDIPNGQTIYRDNWNVFFFAGAARNQVCRQSLAYDTIIPSILFLTHFLPDGPSWARQHALASLCLGGNGIWGDLQSLTAEEIEEMASTINRYKKVAGDVTEAYPLVRGFNGASPEIHEKINSKTGKGLVAVFTRESVNEIYVTQPLTRNPIITGADKWERLGDGRIKLFFSLDRNEARIVFFE
ncbi:alpha-galactosidase [Leadbettera azotonutricia]|uniref:Putative melibiase subfamily n=1 Tax=Leadbettera azotonutricia (strain ATCC BAA-888 / DSM 13862 / ZAS-9) TaxID=545695 RepID=F5YEJ2_LEAAZ|nr:alpha-galactosidase [Leadbettera azotonutricia]AEF81225.1 putative melibiase subfamily [Leadbettera azotonutricia ZAS-9]